MTADLSLSVLLSYSSFVIVMSLNVLKLASMDPPIQAAFFLCKSADTMMSVLAVCSALFLISFTNLSLNPGITVEPPAKTILLYSSFLKSRSHLSIDLQAMSWMPITSLPLMGARLSN